MRASTDFVDYRLELGTGPTLEGRVDVVNTTGSLWNRSRLAIELDVVRTDPDPDHDGMGPGTDLCMDSAEKFDGIDDDDGCPERGRVVWQKNEIEVLERILFKPGRSTIDKAMEPVLDRVVAQLDTVPSLRVVEVQGNADRVEPRAAKLAEARANTVRAALIARGADPARLVAVGRAADLPVDAKRPELTRRVQFGVRERSDEEETVGSAFPVDAPALAATSVQRVMRPLPTPGTTRHMTDELVTAEPQHTHHVTFLRVPVTAAKVLLWTPGAPDLRAGVRLVNTTDATLPHGRIEIVDGANVGAADLEDLEPGEATMLDLGSAGKAPIVRELVERAQSARIIVAKLGFTIVEQQLVRATTFDNAGRDVIYVLHKKGPTRIPASLPAGTVDVGPGWWIPVVPGKLVVEEREVRRHRVRLMDALPKETEPYLADPALPPAVAQSLRDAMAVRTQLLSAQPRSREYYELRTKLRALLTAINFGP